VHRQGSVTVPTGSSLFLFYLPLVYSTVYSVHCTMYMPNSGNVPNTNALNSSLFQQNALSNGRTSQRFRIFLHFCLIDIFLSEEVCLVCSISDKNLTTVSSLLTLSGIGVSCKI
jgi:hypothetical protein